MVGTDRDRPHARKNSAKRWQTRSAKYLPLVTVHRLGRLDCSASRRCGAVAGARPCPLRASSAAGLPCSPV